MKTFQYNCIWVSLMTIICFIMSIWFIYFTFDNYMPQSYGESRIYIIIIIPIIIIGLGINYCKRVISLSNKGIIFKVGKRRKKIKWQEMKKIKYNFLIKQVFIYNDHKIIFTINLFTLKNSKTLLLEIYKELKNRNLDNAFSHSCLKLFKKKKFQNNK